jgi:uncharacterized protein YjhX (UPF0386 family)
MAKLFGKEYHTHSNSWFFKSNIIRLQFRELNYKKYQDENGNVVFKFEAVPQKQNIFTAKLEIVYDKNNRKIISHHCSECGDDECRHYLSVINYTYNYLNTEMLDKEVVQTYHTKLLEYNEYWQRLVLNAKIEIGDIYNQSNDKIRFYLRSYGLLKIRIISILAAGQEIKEADMAEVPMAERQMKALSDVELDLLRTLQQKKCSYSRKGKFYSIYKSDFVDFLPILRNLQTKVFIRETGDKLEFSDEEFRINFQISKVDEDKFLLKTSRSEHISAVFVGKTTYVLKKNVVYYLNLPFSKTVTEQIFTTGYQVKKTDLVYLSSVVARQLGLIKCYLDFEEGIELPPVYHNTPVITFILHKEDDSIVMTGLLKYDDDVFIPMSVIRFPVELVRYDTDGNPSWFYILPQTKYEILAFVDKFPESQSSKLADESKLIFTGKENIA